MKKRFLILNIKNIAFAILTTTLIACGTTGTTAQKSSLSETKTINTTQKPKLVVGIVIDQMRYDYIYKFWNKYSDSGFKKLINGGFFCENTNFSYALKDQPDKGSLRETFFINQLKNAGHKVSLAQKGDFLVDERWTFEVGGKSKSDTQIRKVKNSLLALDEIEHAYLNRIPLWLFGFLY